MTDISVLDYRPDPNLDAELAELGYAAVRGWPDQQPCTPSLVRSMLRPVGLTATTLALHRDADGTLRGAAALRWPATLESSGCLWGPMVDPTATGAGLGKALLDTVALIMQAHPGVRVTTSEIPESRTAGWSIFERAGWHEVGTTKLLKRSLPVTEPMRALSVTEPITARAVVRTVRPREYLDQALATLVADARPDVCYAVARDTYARWTADARYLPDGLLLVDAPEGLAGAALVYPLRHPDPDEPAEAQIAELLFANRLDLETAADVRAALVAGALDAGAKMGAAVARIVIDDPRWTETLQAAGFEIIERYRYYSPPLRERTNAVLAGSVRAA